MMNLKDNFDKVKRNVLSFLGLDRNIVSDNEIFVLENSDIEFGHVELLDVDEKDVANSNCAFESVDKFDMGDDVVFDPFCKVDVDFDDYNFELEDYGLDLSDLEAELSVALCFDDDIL